MTPQAVLIAVVAALAVLAGPHLALTVAAAVIPAATAGAACAVAMCCRRLHREGVLPWA